MLPHPRIVFVVLPLLIGGRPAAGAELEPIGPGPFAVASTNFEVTPRPEVPMFDFLNGKVTPTRTEYITDILSHPEAVPTLTIPVPNDAKRYGSQAGTKLPLVLVVMYPTAADNPRPDYKFPYKETGDNVFPHMQRPGEKPLLASGVGKYPLIVNAGGYNTHTLWHMEHMKLLASHGYIVVDMLHGDGRGSFFAGNLALRSFELRATLDFMLQRSDFAAAIDADRIGAAGQSAGGHTILAAMGGMDPAAEIAFLPDPRVKAAFGLVPFMGASFGFWPFKTDAWFFGEDHAGLRNVHRPFFAVYGEKDENVVPAGVEAGVRAIAGPATAVMLDGESHLVSNPANSDIGTWEILFFDAWLRDDASAREKLKTGTTVRGGVHDHKTIEHAAVPAK